MPYSKSNWFLSGRTGICPCLWYAHHFPLSGIFYIECTYLILCVYIYLPVLDCIVLCNYLLPSLQEDQKPQTVAICSASLWKNIHAPFPTGLATWLALANEIGPQPLMAIFCLFLSQFPFSFYHWHVNGMFLMKAATSGWVPEWNEHDSWSSGDMSISENKSLLSRWDLEIICYKSTTYQKLTDKLLF